MANDDEDWEPDEADNEERDDPIRFEDKVNRCPNCKKDFLGDLDCCPYCGDILFRHLTDGVFAPQSRFWARILFIVIAVLAGLAALLLII